MSDTVVLTDEQFEQAKKLLELVAFSQGMEIAIQYQALTDGYHVINTWYMTPADAKSMYEDLVRSSERADGGIRENR